MFYKFRELWTKFGKTSIIIYSKIYGISSFYGTVINLKYSELMTLIKWFVIIDINEFCIILTHVSISYRISMILNLFLV